MTDTLLAQGSPASTSMMSGADALVRQLLLEGVEHIFGVPGVQLDYATDALARLGGSIEYVLNRHEQGSAYMADGYSRSTGKVGVCMVVPGPGLLNAMAALSTAYATSSRVLCISGQLPLAAIGKGRGALHEVPNQSGLLDSVTKWHAMARTPADVPVIVREAFQQLRSGRPRPVAIEIPPDVLAAVGEVTLIDPADAPDGRLQPQDDDIERAARLLEEAERPVIYAGSGVQAADAGDELLAVAEALQAPVVMSRGGLGSIRSDHPLAATKLEGRPVIEQADVVLAVGTRFLAINGRPLASSETTRVIHIDADPGSMSDPRSPEVGIVADAKLALAALAPKLPRRTAMEPGTAELLERQKAAAAAALAEIQPQMSYLQALRAAMPDDAVLVSEVTQVAYLVRVGFPFLAPRANITSGYQGTLGFGFPTALGAKVGNPDRAVVSINGDGGFGWALQELATAKRHGIALVTVVFNDGAFGNVRRTQRDQFDERYIATDLVNPDFVALAEAFGVRGIRVDGADELEVAVRDAIAADEPVLIEVPVGEMPDPWHLLS